MVLLLRKLYLYFTKDPEAVHYFPGAGGVSNFFRGLGGSKCLFLYTYLLFSRGSVRTPYPPLDPHMGNVIITRNIYHSPASNHNCQALICQDFQVRFSK